MDGKNPQELLLFAASTGDIDTGRQALQAGASVDLNPTEVCATPLYLTAYAGHSGMIELLVEHHAELERADQSGRTPLHMAAYQGHAEAVQALLRSGASINATAKDGCTPLAMAARYGRTEVVNALIQHRARLGILDKEGRSPLLSAAEGGQRTAVKLLLEAAPGVPHEVPPAAAAAAAPAAGADEDEDMEDESDEETDEEEEAPGPLHHPGGYQGHGQHAGRPGAAERFQAWQPPGGPPGSLADALGTAKRLQLREALVLLLEEAGKLPAYHGWQVPLLTAASAGATGVLGQLLDGGWDVNMSAAEGHWTALHVAALAGQVEAAALLLQRGANMEAVTRGGLTPLLCAALGGQAGTLRLLLDRGAANNARGTDGRGAMHLAAHSGSCEALSLLLDEGFPADPPPRGRLGSPLHEAVLAGQVAAIHLLLDRGANIEAPGQSGSTPLYVAIRAKQWEAVIALVERGAKCEAGFDKWKLGWKNEFLDLLPVAALRNGSSLQVRSTVDRLMRAQAQPGARPGTVNVAASSRILGGVPVATAAASATAARASGSAAQAWGRPVQTIPSAAPQPPPPSIPLASGRQADDAYLASNCAGRIRAVDPGQRGATLQVRSEGGQQTYLLKLDAGHTVADVRACLDGLPSRAGADTQYELRCSFPPRLLSDGGETLAAAGLVPNATLLMRTPLPGS